MLYNQQYIPSTKKDLGKYIYNYIHYIGVNSDSKVVFDKGKTHGLFGCVGTKESRHIDSLKDIVQYLRKKAVHEKTILFHGFVSLSADEVERCSYQSKEKWEALIDAKMHVIAKENGIKQSNIEWVAAYHMKREHSHCHLVFWDKAQQIRQPFVPKPLFERKMQTITRAFASEIFKEDFKELYRLKDIAFADIKDGISPFLDHFKSVIANLTEADLEVQSRMLSAISSSFSSADAFNPNFTSQQIATVVSEIMKIHRIVPKEGSLKYGYLSGELKTKIDRSVKAILNCNKACSRAYHSYINSAVEIVKIYSGDSNSAKSEAEKVINRSVGNMLLRAVKELKGMETTDEIKEIHQSEVAFDLLTQIAFAISRGSKSNDARAYIAKNKELSKQAKIELAEKLKSKGIDWGQYER